MKYISKSRRLLISISLVVIIFSLFSGCSEDPKPQTKELLIYCGLTMIPPIVELTKIIEAREKCHIAILQGGSGHLYNVINNNRTGDMFLPCSESYIAKARQKKIISDIVMVGYNQAVLMVQKGNPLKITSEIDNLKDPRYAVVIANPETCGIGRESQQILEKLNLYQTTLNNIAYMTSNSKDLLTAIKKKKADLILEWQAPALWPENRDTIDILPLDEKIAARHQIIIGQLIFSKHPEIVKEFMQLAKSPEGQAIFKRYGFLD